MKGRILHVVLLVSVLISLGACGPGAPQTVKIAVSMPLDPVEGQGMAWTVVNSMKLALEEANNKAGNFDVKFDVATSTETGGTGISSDKEKANAEKAAADPEVLVYIGSLSSGGSKLSIPILNRAGIAQLSSTATYPGLTKPGFAAGEPGIYYPTGKRTFFRVCITDDMQGPAAALWAQDKGLKRVYIVKQDDIFGQGLATTFAQTAQAAGLTIVGTGVVTQSQTTGLEGIVADIAAQQADLVYHAAYRLSGIALIKLMRAKKMTTQVIGATLYTPETITELGADAEGAMATEGGIPTDQLSPAAKDFASRYQKRFNVELGGRTFWAILSYDAMRMTLAAIQQAGKADRAAVLDALRKTQFDGLAGRWSFDENGDTRLLFVSGYYVKDGKWQSVGLLRVR